MDHSKTTDFDVVCDDDLIDWIEYRILQSNILSLDEVENGAISDAHYKTISVFFIHENIETLFIFKEQGDFQVSFRTPLGETDKLLFFVKQHGKIVKRDNVDSIVAYGVLEGNPLESMLQIVKNQFVTYLLDTKVQWPESIKKEFSAHVHKFLASLTETTYKLKGTTKLYVPIEKIPASLKEARKQKDLIQRLEAALIHWTTQIKEVLQEKDQIESSENSRPISEIEYWKARSIDLMNIQKQIQRDDVKQIVEILASSSYLPAFEKVASEIQQGCIEANDNLKFLRTLKQPFEKLAASKPKEIKIVIPEILQTITMIWRVSTSYNTSEKLTSLLRKISNEIIIRCQESIVLNTIFNGDIEASVTILEECIEAANSWRKICTLTFEKMRSSKQGNFDMDRLFDFDKSSVFAEIRAFTQRCKDLLEVCDARLQFGAKGSDGSVSSGLPAFGGTRGPEITKSLLNIRSLFQKHISDLRDLKYNILDVKIARWHDDFGRFKVGIKDLELILVNIISKAFETLTSLENAIELLEAFCSLAKRDTIIRAVTLRTSEIFTKFSNDLENILKYFESNKKNPPVFAFYPPFAGKAMWATSWIERIKRDKVLIDTAYFLPVKDSKEIEEVNSKYQIVFGAMEKYVKDICNEWYSSIVNDMSSMLDIPIMIRVGPQNTQIGLLETNFNKQILSVFEEVRFWSKLPFDIPFAAMDIAVREDKLRIHRENVSLVVREYNEIIKSLSKTEYALFKTKVAALDAKVSPGLTNLTWSSKAPIDTVVGDWKKFCEDTQKIVQDFKDKVNRIYENCYLISQIEIIHIDSKKIYPVSIFSTELQTSREKANSSIKAKNDEIVTLMKELYHYFEKDGAEVQSEWWSFVSDVENTLYESLRTAIKKNLLILSIAINGDKKAEDYVLKPLFLTQIISSSNSDDFYEQTTSSGSIPIMKPSLPEIKSIVERIALAFISDLRAVPKLVPRLTLEIEKSKYLADLLQQQPDIKINDVKLPEKFNQKLPDFSEAKNDTINTEMKEIMVKILVGMDSVTMQIDENLKHWSDSYKNIFVADKTSFARRISQQASATKFASEIESFKDLSIEIQGEENSKHIAFLQLDFVPLKQYLVMECNQFQNRLFDMLQTIASKELYSILDYFDSCTRQMAETPKTLEALGKKLELLDKISDEEKRKRAGISQVHDFYDLLEKYEVNVKEEEKLLQSQLEERQKAFMQSALDARKALSQEQDKFKSKLKGDLDSLVKSVSELKVEFDQNGPFASSLTVKQAQQLIKDFKTKLANKKNEETKVKMGLKVFQQEIQQFKELKDIAAFLETLEKLWNLREEWEKCWEKWKLTGFLELIVDDLEVGAQGYIRELNNSLGREARDWPAWIELKDRLSQFKKTLPLISDLKNPAMRERHWRELAEVIGVDRLDYKDSSFNLEKIIKLGFENYAEDISRLSYAATQELSIEKDLGKIKLTWENTMLDMTTYKETYYILKSTEEVFTNLEENSVTLSSMKASPYAASFAIDVNYWERSLSKISITIEQLIEVQKQWQYLFNIFEYDEIHKQLPEESAIFKSVNTKWRQITNEMAATKIALRALLRDGLLNTLNELIEKLERVKKQLDNYLEVKRRDFPRFYFLSDTDLLEILGQSKDPSAVQKHLENCFEGIYKLKITQSKESRSGGFVATGMYSKGEEYVAFNHPVSLDGAVERWLKKVEDSMRAAIKKNLSKCYSQLLTLQGTAREKWTQDWPGQLIITASQIYWTAKVQSAMKNMKKSKKNPLKEQKKFWNQILKKYSAMVREDLKSLERNKLVALITIEVHARDVIDKLIKCGCKDPDDFEWLKQLRFYVEDDGKEGCITRQTTAEIEYDNEYLGNTGRLVITPLTERCYMTLTTAIQLRRGGNPQGPAGTGKTETVKDLGKAIAKYVIVFNCSDGLDYKSLGRMFSGLVQTGAWSCFDEFNRIELEVLSVVAQQIFKILNAITIGLKTFIFEGSEIPINPSCGIFVTMNPGYAGRSELPDNLKALLRPVSMMVPDSALICSIKLYSQGFEAADVLARKIATLYGLMAQQLSKQTHYDWGLRNITAVLSAAGRLKREQPKADEEILLLTACKDMNIPKFVTEDIPLFNAIIGDLFPGIEHPDRDYGQLKSGIEENLTKHKLQLHPNIIHKIIQLYETKKTRHGVMVVGSTGSGKTTSWRILQQSMTMLNSRGVSGFQIVRDYVINPKSITNDELYGNYDKTRDWKTGVFSFYMKETCKEQTPDEKWIVFDGPVDTLWIESMNTVLDDNKLLTLINGDRISLSEQVSLLFEVQDLAVASPATVSRCGMVFFDEIDLGWQPFIKTWLAKRKSYEQEILKCANPEAVFNLLNAQVDKIVDKVFQLKQECSEVVRIPNPITDIRAFCTLYDSLMSVEAGLEVKDDETYMESIPRMFIFAMIWSVAATVDEEGRKKMDALFREFEPQIPSKDTVYEYFYEAKSRTWKSWEEKVNMNWKPADDTPFYKHIVPTIDTARNSFIVNSLLKAEKNVMIVGGIGTGKTVLVEYVLSQLDDKKYSTHTINFSARTSSRKLQEIVESDLERKSLDIYTPIGGKNLVLFMDDFNMPQKETFGAQPPLELIRQFIDYGFWYDREKISKKVLKNIQMIAAMGPPGGGRNHISARLQSRFNLINVTFPSDSQIKRIFGTLLKHRLSKLEDGKSLTETLTQGTIDIYKNVIVEMLPIPSKSHYVFNLRDLAKVFQGMIQADHESMDKEQEYKLWVHECYRVFYDRLNNDDDRNWFKNQITDKLQALFQVKWQNLYPNTDDKPNLFGYVFSENSYTEMPNMVKLKSTLEQKLSDYNEDGKFRPMNLVLFNYAIEHLCRIHRIIKQPRGNALLIGVGGSGRQSLTRLAAFLSDFQVFTIEITNNFTQRDFHDKLKELYIEAGVKKKQMVFLFSDTQIIEEGFLEDINTILSSGELPNLFEDDELSNVIEGIRKDAMAAKIPETPTELYKFFIDRSRNNMHIVLCMSPVGSSFRERIRMFPGLVNCTNIDWFSDWPPSALEEVALSFLEAIDLGTSGIKPKDKEEDEKLRYQVKASVATVFCNVHNSVIDSSKKMLREVKRRNYVTPTNYLELVKGYIELLKEKRGEIGEQARKLEEGLDTLEAARKEVEAMSVVLEGKKVQAAKSKIECEELLMVILGEKSKADDKKQQVELDRANIQREKEKAEKLKTEAMADLDAARPKLEQAESALSSIDPRDISEIRNYQNPQKGVVLVFTAILTALKKKTDYSEAKALMANPKQFVQTLLTFDKKGVSDSVLGKLSKFVQNPDFTPEKAKSISAALSSLCIWVCVIEEFARIYKGVKPKEERLAIAEAELQANEERLAKAEAQLAEVTERVNKLSEELDSKQREKERIIKEKEETESKLLRAQQLVGGLMGERERWSKSVEEFREQLKNLVGDVLLAAAFLSYAGPFDSFYRNELKLLWMKEVTRLKIPASKDFSFQLFLTKATDVRSWNIQGLPSDSFSIENGALVTRGRRWPLMIDPQGQANRWIKQMEKENKVIVTDAKKKDFLITIENAIKFGLVVLIQDIGEDIDPALEPVLSKAIIYKGNRASIVFNDKELDYNPKFKLYMTSKLSNPHYPPEISTKTTIVNFAVTKQGLEDQLLGIVVSKERPELETQKSEIVLSVAQAKKQMEDLEDKILKLLTDSKDTILEDESLVKTLNESKQTSENIKRNLTISQETEKKIDAARNQYRAAANRASILYFVLTDMGKIDPMYQFSLETYTLLFRRSIDESDKPLRPELVPQRVEMLNDFHTFEVYRTTCQGLFEKDKLLFSFQICVKILQDRNDLNIEEYSFFLKGGQVLDKESQTPNPCSNWLPEQCWDNIFELDKLTAFHGLVQSFEEIGNSQWKDWYCSTNPETEQLPAEWQQKVDFWQRMVIVRALRADRVMIMIKQFVSSKIGEKYTNPPVNDVRLIYQSSDCETPFIFILSPGVDPQIQLEMLAASEKVKLKSLSLGQGQDITATEYIAQAVEAGDWVFLANCHLMVRWLIKLEQIIEGFGGAEGKRPHEKFRLWLSSKPHPKFPITILQKARKITTEPPQGLKSNLLRLYNTISEDKFNKCVKKIEYQRLLFALAFFHSILIERRKFGVLGWNVPYEFNDSDFSISEDILQFNLNKYEIIPWEALRYLIADASYGGRVTDDMDRRILEVYINQYFSPNVITTAEYGLSDEPRYHIPKDGDLNVHFKFIKELDSDDPPNAFGQHPNADISSLIVKSQTLLDSLLSLLPQTASSGADGQTPDAKVFATASDLLENRIPALINRSLAEEADQNALNTVLLQEISRYNKLLTIIRNSLADLLKGIKGEVVMNAELDEVYNYLLDGKVPPLWQKAYPSLKPLASWTRDLISRIDQLRKWAEGDPPLTFWLSGFTFPSGFLTALKQTTARAQNVAVDELAFEFTVMRESVYHQRPKEGAYIQGIFLEGSGWDKEKSQLAEPEPMELVSRMPIIHFKPILNKKKPGKDIYQCPLYVYPNRSAENCCVITVDLKCPPEKTADYFVKRATALLLQTAD